MLGNEVVLGFEKDKLFFLHEGHQFSGGDRYVNNYRKLRVAGTVPQQEVGFVWIFEGYEKFSCLCLPGIRSTLLIDTWF